MPELLGQPELLPEAVTVLHTVGDTEPHREREAAVEAEALPLKEELPELEVEGLMEMLLLAEAELD